MDALKNILQVIKPDVYMASINLKDNFVSVKAKHQLYLRGFVRRYLSIYISRYIRNIYAWQMNICKHSQKIGKFYFHSSEEDGLMSAVFIEDSHPWEIDFDNVLLIFWVA